MRKRNCVIAILLMLGSLVNSPELLAQSRPLVTRTALSRMDVLSRAGVFERTILEAARKENVDPLVLWTIAYNETRFRPWLTSPKNARGLMQFIPATASRFGLADPYEPTASIHAAARYVKYLDGLFGRRIESVLAAYNSGEGTVLGYLLGRSFVSNGKIKNANRLRTPNGVPPYKETLDYVASGKRIYRWLTSQGRFREATNGAEIYTADQGNAREKEISEEVKSPSSATTTVLYEPRTGRRFLVGADEKNGVRPIDHNGPVIISPDLRSLPAQKARSTFAGLILQ